MSTLPARKSPVHIAECITAFGPTPPIPTLAHPIIVAPAASVNAKLTRAARSTLTPTIATLASGVDHPLKSVIEIGSLTRKIALRSGKLRVAFLPQSNAEYRGAAPDVEYLMRKYEKHLDQAIERAREKGMPVHVPRVCNSIAARAKTLLSDPVFGYQELIVLRTADEIAAMPVNA